MEVGGFPLPLQSFLQETLYKVGGKKGIYPTS